MQIIQKTSDFITTARLVIVASAVLILVAIGFVVSANNHQDGDYRRVVTIYDQGRKTSIITKANTVGRAVELANIDIFEGDKIEPSSETALTNNDFTINIYRSRPVLVVDGLTQKLVMSTYANPRDIVKQSGINTREEDRLEATSSGNILVDGASVRVDITRAKAVDIVLYGVQKTVYTHADTIEDFLSQNNISLDKDTSLSADRSTKITDGIKLEI